MGQVLTQPIQSQLLQRKGNEQFKVGFAEMQGFRMAMEDCHTITPSLSEKFPKVGLFGVFDGHAGERAAIYLEAELHKRIAALENPTDVDQLSECVQKLDADFLSDPIAREDGSTCTFCVVHPIEDPAGKCWEIIAVNVGDSRSMIIRADGSCVGLTEDHKPEDQHEDARIRAAGGHVSMNRVDGQLAMSRAIGDWNYKKNPDLPLNLQKVIAVPDIQKGKLYENDRLLVCCDGIVEQMSSEDAVDFSYLALNKQKAVCEVEDLARVCWELNLYSLKRGSKDNHSCMIIAPESGASYQTKDEFCAGPFHPYAKNEGFREAYLADARKHGVEAEQAMEMARQAEANMPDLPQEAQDDDDGGGGLNMQALQALMGQPGAREMLTDLIKQRQGGGGDQGDGGGL